MPDAAPIIHSNAPQYARIPTWLWNHGLSANAISCYGALMCFADRFMECYPSRETLAERMSTSTDTVDRAIKELKDLGALRVVRRGLGHSNYYQIEFFEENLSRTRADTDLPESANMPTPEKAPVQSQETAGKRSITRTSEPNPINHVPSQKTAPQKRVGLEPLTASERQSLEEKWTGKLDMLDDRINEAELWYLNNPRKYTDMLRCVDGALRRDWDKLPTYKQQQRLEALATVHVTEDDGSSGTVVFQMTPEELEESRRYLAEMMQ